MPQQNLLEQCHELSDYVFKNSVCYVQSPNGNKKPSGTQFSENDEIIFYLLAISQCEQGGEGTYETQFMRIR